MEQADVVEDCAIKIIDKINTPNGTTVFFIRPVEDHSKITIGTKSCLMYNKTKNVHFIMLDYDHALDLLDQNELDISIAYFDALGFLKEKVLNDINLGLSTVSIGAALYCISQLYGFSIPKVLKFAKHLAIQNLLDNFYISNIPNYIKAHLFHRKCIKDKDFGKFIFNNLKNK